jgi:hypothetical protein
MEVVEFFFVFRFFLGVLVDIGIGASKMISQKLKFGRSNTFRSGTGSRFQLE